MVYSLYILMPAQPIVRFLTKIIIHKVINLNLAIANCCSIANKQVELEQFLISHQVDIFLGTESHLDSSVLNAEVFPNHYNVYRKDRNKYGGGVFIIIRESIPSSQLEITSPNEIIWVQLHTGSYKSVIVGSFYCPPHSPATTWEDLLLLLLLLLAAMTYNQVHYFRINHLAG